MSRYKFRAWDGERWVKILLVAVILLLIALFFQISALNHKLDKLDGSVENVNQRVLNNLGFVEERMIESAQVVYIPDTTDNIFK